MKIGGKIGGGGGGGGGTKDFAPEYENIGQNTLCSKKRITASLKIKPLGQAFT